MIDAISEAGNTQHKFRGVNVAASFSAASAQQPERTEVREDCEHCQH